MALNRTRPLAVTVLLLLIVPALLAPFASAGSHSHLTVALWNDDAMGLGAGDSFTVWAQVFDGQTAVNVTSVTFFLGFNFPPVVTPVPYPGVYAGTPGLYNATVTLTATDAAAGATVLGVDVIDGTETASSSRIVVLQFPGGGPFGGSGDPWTVHAGVDNLDELGQRVDPGETVVWRIDTALNGTATNASSLTADLYESTHVTFGETPTALTPVNVGPGSYEVRYTVPTTLNESRQYVLQAHISETNDAWSNGTADVWFHDLVADFSEASGLRLSGSLTVGDGAATIQGATVAIEIHEDGNASNVLGQIAGTTNATGQVAFNMSNSGTTDLVADGWVNTTSHAQRVYRMFSVKGLYLPPAPDASRFDAIPLTDASQVPWAGVQTFPYEFWDNGTLAGNTNVNAYVWNARGAWQATPLLTDGQGRANLTIDFDSAPPFSFEDLAVGGINVTFRTPQGPDTSASDGIWWGEDEEHLMPDPTATFLEQLVDTNMSFTTQTFTLGSAFGVGAKYTGAKNTTGWVGGAALFPGGLLTTIGGRVDRYAVWTGSDVPYITYMVDGDAQEFFGCMQIPSYWPDTTYSLVGVQAPSLAWLSSEDGPPVAGSFAWTDLTVGGSLSQFAASPDTTAPSVRGVGDLSVDLGQPLDLSAIAYDNSLDFCDAGNYTWSFNDPNFGTVQVFGKGTSVTLQSPGVIAGQLSVRDGTGNTATVDFNVTVNDTMAPAVDAGANQSVLVGDLVNLTCLATDDDPSFPAGATFNWSFGYNGSNVTLAGPNATHRFDIAGDYVARCTVTDATGNEGSDNTTIHVAIPDSEPPTVDAGPDLIAHEGDTVTIIPNVTDNDPTFPAGAVFLWEVETGGVVVNTSDVEDLTVTLATAGLYNMTLTVWDAAGNNASDALQVTVLPPDTTDPTVDAGPDQTVWVGTTVDFAGTASDDDPNFPAGALIEWNFSYNGSFVVLTGLTPSFTFDVAGTYLIALEVTDASGNRGADTLTVEVLPPDTEPPVVDAGPDWNVVAGTTVTLAGTATDNDPFFPNGSTAVWNFTVGTTPYTSSGLVWARLFDTPGVYVVTLNVTDAAGNSGTDTTTVTVIPVDTTAPSIAPIPNQETMTGVLFTFEAVVTDDSANFSTTAQYNWTFTHNGTDVDLSGATATFTFTTSEVVDVTLTVSDWSGNTATATFKVTVRAPDTTPPVIDLASTTMTGVVGREVLFTAAASDGGNPIIDPAAFVWTFTDQGTPVTLTGGTVTHTFNAAGTYNVTLTVTDAAGNAASRSITVTISEAPADTGGLDPMLLVGLLVAVVVIVGAGFALTRKRGGSPPAGGQSGEGGEQP